MSRFLFFVSFLLLLLFSYWVGGGVLYPLGAGVFLALFYLVLVGVVFFFHVVPNVGRRVLEAAVLVVLFASFHVYPPLALTAIPALFFVLLYPVHLGWRHGVFKDLTHVFSGLFCRSRWASPSPGHCLESSGSTSSSPCRRRY
jgi:hypothetical protein